MALECPFKKCFPLLVEVTEEWFIIWKILAVLGVQVRCFPCHAGDSDDA